jgi:hypothetical protein
MVHRHHLEVPFTMAAAAVPHTLFSALYGDGSYWELPTPDYVSLSKWFGAGSAANIAATPNECHNGLAGTAARSPMVVAFVTDADCDDIYHSFFVIYLHSRSTPA